MHKIILITVCCLIYSYSWASKEPRTHVKFKIDCWVGGVEGSFEEVSTEVIFDKCDLENTVISMVISTTSINLDSEKFEELARQKHFFDVDQYPELLFQLVSIWQTSEGYQARGNIEIKGIKQELLVPVRLVSGEKCELLESSFILKRSNFNIGNLKNLVKDHFQVSVSIPTNFLNK